MPLKLENLELTKLLLLCELHKAQKREQSSYGICGRLAWNLLTKTIAANAYASNGGLPVALITHGVDLKD